MLLTAGCPHDAGDLVGGEQPQGGEVADGLGRAAQQVYPVGGLAQRVPLRDDDPGGDPGDEELRRQVQVGGAERVDGVVPGDDVEGRVSRPGPVPSW